MCLRSFRLRQLNRPFALLSFTWEGVASAHCLQRQCLPARVCSPGLVSRSAGSHLFWRQDGLRDNLRCKPVSGSADDDVAFFSLGCERDCGHPGQREGAVSNRASGPDGLRRGTAAPSNGGRNGGPWRRFLKRKKYLVVLNLGTGLDKTGDEYDCALGEKDGCDVRNYRALHSLLALRPEG